MRTQSNRSKRSLKIRETVIFAMLGALMYASKIVMEALPNIHLLGMFTIVYTIVFRKKALIPIYVYVMLNGLFAGFSVWWIPYLYIWTILWAVVMILPKKMPKWLAYIVYPLLCALHGLAFGILYAPAQAIMFGFTFDQMIAWILAGIPFDVVHCFGNFAAGLLIIPISDMLSRLVNKRTVN